MYTSAAGDAHMHALNVTLVLEAYTVLARVLAAVCGSDMCFIHRCSNVSLW